MKAGFRRAVFTLALIVLLAGIHLYIYTQNIDLKYQLTDLKVKLRELRNKNRALGSKVAAKESLANIEKYAREKLKMVYPGKVNYVLIPDNNKAKGQ